MAVMFAARGCKSLIIVDACRSGSEPGAIFDVPGGEIEARATPALSTHEFRWEQALYTGRKIFRDSFPSDISVFLIEAESLALGLELSPSVARAAVMLADRIERLALEKAACPAL
jgi:hydrogenase maturation protease